MRAAVTIRRAGPDDAAPLATLAERTFRDAFAIHNSTEDMDAHCARCFGTGIQSKEIADPRLITLVAESDGHMAGYSQLQPSLPNDCVTGDRPAELKRLYVASAWHGRGVAHELMRFVFSAVAGVQGDCVWLGVWEHNSRAIAFYRKFGFRIVGSHDFMLGRDLQRDLIMVAPVQPGESSRKDP